MSDINTAAFQFSQPWVSAGLQVASNAMNYKYNKKMLKLQNQYNLDMWQKQADYNSPQAQMQRFQEAGLNPNLIYGQGSNGNMNSAPQMVAPEAPYFDKAAEELSKAFNIANLQKAVAESKKAQEEARLTELHRFDKEDERDTMTRFQDLWSYNTKTGRYEFHPADISVSSKNPRGSRIGDRSTTGFRFDKFLSERDSRLWFEQLKRAYLSPQIQMLRFENRWQPLTYGIGMGTKVLHSLPLPKLNWSFQNKTFNKSY